ncbi:heavy metal translocating P-type ATPase [Stomatobaculum longum]|uniref:heavy metal translocating P-type ATPase n=1 Tax=Stomatobaculum longum TaxID=796942 RepID=UPI0028EC51A1|nr:heavy metal translocating P-type ATPase [Stomatobaculum longum]
MRYTIRHESRNVMRVHLAGTRMSLSEADILEYYLRALPFVQDVKIFERTCDAIVKYNREADHRERLIDALCDFSYRDEYALSLVPEDSGRAMNRYYQEKLFWKVVLHGARMLFLPAPLRAAWTAVKSLRYVVTGVTCLLTRGLEVPVLDATAISASVLRSDFGTASSVMFLLEVGEILEEWTHKKSVGDLARAMSLQVEKVWMKTEGADVLIDVKDVQVGDRIVVRTSNVIPLDGTVVEGEMTVNQASMTGESVPVEKKAGAYVYAGTVVEEGECIISVAKVQGTGHYDKIVKMIEESEKLKSNTEARAYHLADSLVPYSLGGAALTFLLTRNVAKALAFLMVDFSCALKLSMPLSVLSAIREAGDRNVSVKGGKFLEAIAEADTIVFDKTGTLTRATPTVMHIETFNDMEEAEALKIAACLEEHYPHSIANAVVGEAKKRGIRHKEMHSKVHYVVAHGIASEIDGKKVVIGSYHFVFEDEKCKLLKKDEKKLEALPDEYSRLYLAIDGKLCAVICIFDPIREEAPEIVKGLRALGISKICMMTGDSEKTAAAVAAQLELDEYHAEVLPGTKAEFVRKEHEAGRKVIMIGDGVNDTPALSEADVGIAISDGAAIAREVADVTLSAENLRELVFLRALSMALMRRIHSNYNFIIGFNALLIALGVGGMLPPATGALLHNGSTLVTGLKSMTNLLEEEKSA